MRLLDWQRRLDGLASILAFCAFCYVLGLLIGCTPPASPQEAAAEGAYGLSLQRCVDQYATEEDIDACAAGVRARWQDGGR
jgi:hypothetical protein